MNVLSVLAGLALFQPIPVDSAAIYSAILRQVRSEYDGRPVALAETRSGIRCMPLCGADLREPDALPPSAVPAPETRHSQALLNALRERGLIDASCATQPSLFGCATYPQHLFVALGEISQAPSAGPSPVEGAVWVQTAFLVPCGCATREAPSGKPCHPDMFGYWYLMMPTGPDGTWTVVRRAPGFTAA